MNKLCKIEGCNEKHFAKGLCRKHYDKQYFQDNKKHFAEWRKQYYQTPSGKASNKAHSHNRRALTNDLTKETVQLVYEDNIKKYGTLTCILCNKPIAFGEDSLDHLTPLTRQGTNNYVNLGVAHIICNSKKGTKTLEEWFNKNKKEAKLCQ